MAADPRRDEVRAPQRPHLVHGLRDARFPGGSTQNIIRPPASLVFNRGRRLQWDIFGLASSA